MKDFDVKIDGVEIKKETVGKGNVEKLSLEIPNIVTIKEGRSTMSTGFSMRTRETSKSVTFTLEVKINTSGKKFALPTKLSELLEGLGITEEDMEDLAREISKEAVVGILDGKEAAIAWATPLFEKVKKSFDKD